MKNAARFGTLFLFGIILALPGFGATILNGDFEQGAPSGGAANWTDTSTNFGVNRCDVATCSNAFQSVPMNSGTYWIWFGGTPAAETGVLSQTVNFATGGSTFLSAYIWNLNNSITSAGTFTVMIDSTLLFTLDGTAPTTSSYVMYSWDVSAFADGGNHTIQFQLVKGATTQPVNIFLDDVSLTQAPEPSNLALCAFGLGALLWCGKRDAAGQTQSRYSEDRCPSGKQLSWGPFRA